MPPKCLRRHLPHHEKIKLLDLLKEGKSYAEVARHYLLNESTVRYIKKSETKIRMTEGMMEMSGSLNDLNEESNEQNFENDQHLTGNIAERCFNIFNVGECTEGVFLPKSGSTESKTPKRKRKPNLHFIPSAISDGDEAEIEVEVEEEESDQVVKHKAKKTWTPKEKQEKNKSQPSIDQTIKEEKMNDELICPKCQRIFKMRAHLEEHLLSHFSDAGPQCPACERFFGSRSKLRLHQLRKDCKKTQRSHKAAPAHRHLAAIRADVTKEEPSRRRYPCFTCGKSFGQSSLLKSHMIAHRVRTPKTSVHCFYEGCVFRSHLRRAHVRHFAAEHGTEGVGCSYQACVAVFPTMAQMEVHFKSHMAYHCAECDFACSSKAFLVQHQRKGHKGSEALACKFCHYVTFNPVELKRHGWHRHAGEKKHGCEQCSYMTSNKGALARHMLTHTGEKPYQCELCDFRCRDETYLPKHMLTHSGERNFLCEECGYVTKWKHSLNVHMRKHGKDLRYGCDQCSYRCHRVDQLKSHKVRHQAKSLMCEICAYACKRPAELRNHMLTKHSFEGHSASAHKCQYCAYTTAFKQALQNHENCKHTRLKQYRCALCPYFSFSGVSLFLHKKKAHGYVPGDKAWLENYVAKERERNSKSMLRDPPLVQKSSEKSTEECVRMKRTHPEASVEQIASVAHSQAVPSPDANQIVMNEGLSHSPHPEASPEYCTLVLTTLTPDSETSPLPNVDSASDVIAANTNTNSPKDESRTTHRDQGERSPHGPNNAIPDTPPEKNPILGRDPNSHPTKNQPLVLDGRIQMLKVPTPAANRHISSCQKQDGQKVGEKPQILEVPFSGSDSRLGENQEKTNPIQIPICASKPKPLAQKRTVEQERRKAPNPNGSTLSHVCHYCSFATARRYRLKAHESLHTGSGRHACGVCDKTFGAATKLRQHEARAHRGEPALPCLLCDYRAHTAEDVRRHARRCHAANSGQHCPDCQARFSSKAALRNHRQRAHPPHDLVDPGESTRKKRQRSEQRKTLEAEAGEGTHLAQHLLNQSSSPDQALRGGSSEMTCRQPRKHLYECPDCKYSTVNRQKISWHVRIHTGEKPYRCERCSYACVDPSRLKLHMRVHQDEKKYLCPECGYKCKWATQLKYHMTKHTGEKRYTCDQCEYRTNRADALRAHQTTRHCDVRAYVCEECGKAFKSNFILKTHQRQHGERRRYECGVCHKAFRWPAGLRHHFLSHGDRLPFGCRRCPYRAKQRFQVVKHLKRHHPGTPADQGVQKDSDVGRLTLQEAMRGAPNQTVSGEEAGK